MQSPIFGPAYQARSSNLAANQLVNLYQQIVDNPKSSSGKAIGALEGTPGLDLLCTVGTGPIRAMLAFDFAGVGDLLFVVSGNSLYQVDGGFGGGVHLGDLSTTNDGAVEIVCNGVQLMVVNGWNAYSYNPVGTVFAPITLPFVFPTNANSTDNPITLAEIDGFVVANQPGYDFWYQSNLKDVTTWDALNFGEASGEPDDLVRMSALHRELVLVKKNATEFWYNAGTSGLEFARIDGQYLEVGCVAPATFCRSGDSLLWMARNQEGEAFAVEMPSAGRYDRVSTQALEAEWQTYGIADATAYTYQQHGHEFWIVNFPDGDVTWCLDRTASRKLGEPCWHQRARYEPLTGTLHRHIGNCATLFNHRIVVGDYQTGKLYAYNLATLTDAGNQRKWLRRWRALQKPTMQPVTFSEVTIDMQTGIGIDPAANPLAMLRWSDDGARTWSNERKIPVGKLGETARRVRALRCGQTRQSSGLDRIFELSSTDVFPVSITGADVSVS